MGRKPVFSFQSSVFRVQEAVAFIAQRPFRIVRTGRAALRCTLFTDRLYHLVAVYGFTAERACSHNPVNPENRVNPV